MLEIYILLALAAVLLVYGLFFQRDIDKLDNYGNPVYRKRK